ncbi:hypothetical protein GCM10023164_11140 [Christiangramia aestuarii]
MLVNANAVVRAHNVVIEIDDIDDVEITTTRIVTVLNEAGEKYIDAFENFDEGRSILDQEAIIYDGNGREIKKFKKRHFTSQSNFQDFVLFSDNQVSYLNFTPRGYPYTVSYKSRIRTNTSIFLPDWWPLEGYKVSVENSSYELKNEKNIPVRYSERNLEGLEVISSNSNNELKYSAKNIPARNYEDYSPAFEGLAPRVMVALEEYSLEGIEGRAKDWKSFGKWQYENLVAGTGELSDEIVRTITELTKNAQTTEEKARIIYKYVQENTRYIAVMLGIGGWKPYPAAEVDRLGYGDCKGLSNFTKALLASQGIEADYTVIYGGPKRDIDPGFTKMQGNHVVLSLPQEGKEDIWLECTNQDIPFNYLGDSTDDRYALKIRPTGGEIVRTPKYSADDNLKSVNAEVMLNETGGFSAEIHRTSSGVPYGNIYPIELQKKEVQENYYRENWGHFQNITIEELNYTNDKRKIEFTENLKIKADRFCRLAGNRLLLPLSFLEVGGMQVDKDTDRKNNIKINRGKTFKDSYTYTLPESYEVEALPENREIETEFGLISFSTEVLEKEGRVQIAVEKYLQILDGEWTPDKFEDFRSFINEIHKINNQKAVIVPTSKT